MTGASGSGAPSATGNHHNHVRWATDKAPSMRPSNRSRARNRTVASGQRFPAAADAASMACVVCFRPSANNAITKTWASSKVISLRLEAPPACPSGAWPCMDTSVAAGGAVMAVPVDSNKSDPALAAAMTEAGASHAEPATGLGLGAAPAGTAAGRPIGPPAFAPRIALIIAVLSVGISAILIRWVEDAPALSIAFYRLFFTTLMIAPVAFWKHRAEFANLSRKDLVVALVVGAVLAVHFASWIESLFHTSVASSVIIVSMEAILATIGAAVFLGERVARRSWMLIGVAFVGVALLALGDAGGFSGGGPDGGFPRAMYGNMLAFIGAIAAAIYFVAGRNLRQRVHLILYVGIVYWMCSVVLFAFALAGNAPLTGFSARTWTLFVLMAIFPTIGGHTLFNWSLRYLRAATVSTAILGEPIVAAVLAALVFQEIPGALGLVGGAIALVGILGVVRTSEKETHGTPEPAVDPLNPA